MGTRQHLDRRQFIAALTATGATGLAAPVMAQTAPIPARPFVQVPIPNPIPRTSQPMKIGVIGSGNVGGTLGEIWWKAGYLLMFSDRDPAQAAAQAGRMAGAQTGTPEQVIAWADVVFISVPFGAWPDVARQYGQALRGKLVFEPTNPSASRDGAIATAALAKGSGNAIAELLPGVRIVRGFNTFSHTSMGKEANRPGEKVGVPMAATDPATMAIGARLVRDAGFDPVEVPGGMAAASRFELGGPAAGVKTAAELRQILKL
jgi:8-hydroxy-5-deazaflavin:NADPH oxidoreductase